MNFGVLSCDTHSSPQGGRRGTTYSAYKQTNNDYNSQHAAELTGSGSRLEKKSGFKFTVHVDSTRAGGGDIGFHYIKTRTPTSGHAGV